MQSTIAAPAGASTSTELRWMPCAAHGKCPVPHVEGMAHYHALALLPSGKTQWVPLDARIARENSVAATAAGIEVVLEVASGAWKDGAAETVSDYAKRWLESREGRVNSIRDDRSRLRDHVLPLVGDFAVATLTRDDVENVRDALDGKITSGALNWKTVRNAWATFTKMCDDMANAKRRELRVRVDNPAFGVRAPDRGSRKLKQYLFPNEVLRFASCEDVPRTWRRNLVVAVYLYLRDGELRELRWEDVDLEHRLVHVHHAYNRRTKQSKTTKTGNTRSVPIHENLLPLLRTMHAEANGVGLVLSLPSERTMARSLRRWLRRAGVTRDALFEASPTRKPLTWHDARATGVTWLAVAGLDATKIQRRAGHTTIETTMAYIREAESFAGEAFGTPFPPLPLELLAANPSTVGAAGSAEGWTGQVGGVDGTRTRFTCNLQVRDAVLFFV
jgi:integrase